MSPAEPTTAGTGTMRFEFATELEAALEVARRAHVFLTSRGVPVAEADGWRIVLAEALNNAVLHCAPGYESANLSLQLTCEPQQVEALLVDRTPGFDWPEQVALPDPSSEGLRGLFLIRALTDSAQYHRCPGNNRLVLRKRRGS